MSRKFKCTLVKELCHCSYLDNQGNCTGVTNQCGFRAPDIEEKQGYVRQKRWYEELRETKRKNR